MVVTTSTIVAITDHKPNCSASSMAIAIEQMVITAAVDVTDGTIAADLDVVCNHSTLDSDCTTDSNYTDCYCSTSAFANYFP